MRQVRASWAKNLTYFGEKCATELENPHYDGVKPLITGKLSKIRTTPAVARFLRRWRGF